MAPSSLAPPPEHEILEQPVEEQIEQAQQPRDFEPPREDGRAKHALFADSLLDLSTTRPGQRTLDFVLSMIVHAIFLGTLILLPLYFTEAIDLKQFTQTFLVAPPPPPPPPPPAPAQGIVKVAAGPRRVFTQAGKLLAPSAIPQQVAMLKEQELPPEVGGAGVVGGVPGGVPGGQLGGVIGGIISGAQRTYVPVAPVAAPQPKAPIRVGGRVKPPRAISTPDPVYPGLARQARIQGDVLIDAVIDTHGNVVEMQVISGHPLLIPAAMEVLHKWKYEPTYLNEEPVSVQLIVTIRFRLG